MVPYAGIPSGLHDSRARSAIVRVDRYTVGYTGQLDKVIPVNSQLIERLGSTVLPRSAHTTHRASVVIRFSQNTKSSPPSHPPFSYHWTSRIIECGLQHIAIKYVSQWVRNLRNARMRVRMGKSNCDVWVTQGMAAVIAGNL